jgi:hypothetical protein
LIKTFRRKTITDEQKKQVREIQDYFLMTATDLDELLPENTEKTTCLRKLREAEECALTAVIYPE